MAEEIKDTIESIAKDGVRRAQGDQGSMETHSIPDLIQAAEYGRGKVAAKRPGRKIRYERNAPPGATGT